MGNQEIYKKVLERIKPEKKLSREVEEFIKKINKLLKKAGLKAECVKGGSTAKGTFLKGDHDIDLFIKFDQKYKNKNISNLLEQALKKLELERIHGSRDYFQLEKGEHAYELVPVLNIEHYEEAENITDMSPIHVEHIHEKLEEKPELADEIRLAKQFCKAKKCYGAESYIKGFSGHVLDILTIHYGGFEELLKAVKEWGEKTIIDPEEKIEGNPLKELNKSKTESPLIIIDPVQPDRNSAAALSKKIYEKFKKEVKNFLKNPSEEDFRIKELTKERIRKKGEEGEKTIILKAGTLEGKHDVAGAKALKVHEIITQKLEEKGFNLREEGWEYKEQKEEAIYYYTTKDEKLSKYRLRKGPRTEQKNHYKRFLKAHKNEEVIEKKGRAYVKEKREYREAELLIRDLLENQRVEERVKKIEVEEVIKHTGE